MRVLSSLSMTTLLISLFRATPAGAAEISLQLRVLRLGLLQDGSFSGIFRSDEDLRRFPVERVDFLDTNVT
jgi:hypothetical protein